ncbi:OmpA family protein [Dongshaea marina]|uniref:OmpA family protein n=1 Tax=Dongshaea marina TaxID=2047966 RepID=UPI000D3E40A5|nr:OmpA family protein [Dongshaea marina]
MRVEQCIKRGLITLSLLMLAACSSTPSDSMASADQGKQMPWPLQKENTVHFDTDKSVILPKAKPRLDAIACYLRGHPDATVVIDGNADERGSNAYNLALGERRARSVADYLMSEGVPGDQLWYSSWGESKPADAASNHKAYAKNRRALTLHLKFD